MTKNMEELLSFENVTKEMNRINKALYGVEPYKERRVCGEFHKSPNYEESYCEWCGKKLSI